MQYDYHQRANAVADGQGLEIRTWCHWSTYRKWQPDNQMVTWPSRDPERSRSWPNMLRTWYLEIGWRYRLGLNGPPIGYGLLRFEWSCDWWRYVAHKGQYHDPNIFGVHYLDNGWRYRFCYNGVPIRYDYLRIKWPMTSRDPERSRLWHLVTLKVKIVPRIWYQLL